MGGLDVPNFKVVKVPQEGNRRKAGNEVKPVDQVGKVGSPGGADCAGDAGGGRKAQGAVSYCLSLGQEGRGLAFNGGEAPRACAAGNEGAAPCREVQEALVCRALGFQVLAVQAAIGPSLGPEDISDIGLKCRWGSPNEPVGEGAEGAPAVAFAHVLSQEVGIAG